MIMIAAKGMAGPAVEKEISFIPQAWSSAANETGAMN